ncbi:MAG TPA: hypothetical protein VGS11_10890 [Candidatus Bathyarchaeia archaeon]|nr:hypothetical protein [Candidatus Bathyarchaeia archaeon]
MTRGCGDRQDQALYATVPSSPFGKPIDYFLVDPTIRFDAKNLRAPMLVPDPEGIVHVVLGVSAEFYPTIPDFVEEARVMGISKRLPRDFDPKKLTPGKSKLLLFHPKATPDFPHEKLMTKETCPTLTSKDHECIGELWPLCVYEPSTDKHTVVFGLPVDSIKTPSTSYQVRHAHLKIRGFKMVTTKKEGALRPNKPLKYLPGIFLAFPTFNFEYVSKSGEIPADVVERIDRAGYELKVVPE